MKSFAVGAAVYDGKGKLVSADAVYASLLGKELTSLIGVRRDTITHPEDQARNMILIDRFQQSGEPFEITKRYVKGSGEPVWVQNHISRLLGDETAKTLVLSRPAPEALAGGERNAAGRLSFAGVVSETAAAMGLESRRFGLTSTATLLEQAADIAIPEALKPHARG